MTLLSVTSGTRSCKRPASIALRPRCHPVPPKCSGRGRIRLGACVSAEYAERVYTIEAAHNPEVAGSNPAPATDKGAGKGPLYFSLAELDVLLQALAATRHAGSSISRRYRERSRTLTALSGRRRRGRAPVAGTPPGRALHLQGPQRVAGERDPHPQPDGPGIRARRLASLLYAARRFAPSYTSSRSA
jgi:hypothetical protein